MNRIVIKPHVSKERSEENADEAAPRFDAKWELPKTDGERVSFSLRKAEPTRFVPRASWLWLAFWLGSFSVLWAALFVAMPAFEKMFQETGFVLPAPTEAVIACSHFVRSPLGVLSTFALVAGSTRFFLRARERKGLADGLLYAGLLTLGLVGVIAWTLFLALSPCCIQKL